jgi:DivIVA domain-containing protein
MEEFSAAEVRARTFRVAVRGFDRDEVNEFLGAVGDYLEAVQQHLHRAGLAALASPRDLASEYAAIGDEVASVLAEARAAADAMRSRAAAETATWRAEVESELNQARAETAAVNEEARRSAWETATEMLDQVVAECESMLAEAHAASLRIRSEAERESTRVLTNAQREKEEMLRAGRDEGERTVSSARKEADALLMSVRRQADVAEERTRALEARRAELMEELESAQKALLGIEEPVGSDEGDEAAESPPPEVDTTRSHWPEDDGAVRIVSRPSVPNEPVDADALAAEVEALRGRAASAPVSPSARDATADTPPSAAAPLPRPPAGEESVEPVSPPEGGEGFEEKTPESPPSAAAPLPLPPNGEETGGEAGPDHETDELTPSEAAPPSADAGEPTDQRDPLAGLFEELRTTTPEPMEAVSDNGDRGDGQLAAVATLVEEAVELPKESEPAHPPPPTDLDPFALRDRLLLPVQNRALRLVKRQFVSAQNRALEELRLDPDWVPEPDLIDGQIGEVLVDLADESTAAGFAAAAELLDRSDPPSPQVEIVDPTDEFVNALLGAATLSLERSRGAGAGKREVASSLSRVFRAWRTDDAERRGRFLSRRAYHAGVLAALMAMDCERASIVPLGSSCVDHGDGSPPWLIVDGPPPGTVLPPASLECGCTVVPDC